MLRINVIGALAALGLLAGCAYDVGALRDAEGTGSAFSQALTEEYRQFATFEADEMFDWPDAGYFARKGLAAAAGNEVGPEELDAWDLPVAARDELAPARTRLLAALDGGGRTAAPELAARAQARFDCWVEQAEENHQPDHISACKDEFFRALEELEASLTPPVPPVTPQPAADTYVVLFDFDRADITPAGQAVINNVLQDASARGAPAISVTGHADRSGPEDYNMALSLRRADAVREALVAGGIAPELITVQGRGESEPAVPTPDGQREQANRRVEIIIQ